mmetsp:Transcript_17889/g.33344  ORF Transcript_17889/g.33344 Transcript_17889/m.33344 type:complete len:221 (+) Transcript_17889:407-1069(+)
MDPCSGRSEASLHRLFGLDSRFQRISISASEQAPEHGARRNCGAHDRENPHSIHGPRRCLAGLAKRRLVRRGVFRHSLPGGRSPVPVAQRTKRVATIISGLDRRSLHSAHPSHVRRYGNCGSGRGWGIRILHCVPGGSPEAVSLPNHPERVGRERGRAIDSAAGAHHAGQHAGNSQLSVFSRWQVCHSRLLHVCYAGDDRYCSSTRPPHRCGPCGQQRTS